MATDHKAAMTEADAAMGRASDELDSVLAGICANLDPFPAFMGHPTLEAVEVEDAPAIMAAVGAADPDLGCVVACPDGKLYELVMRMTPDETDERGLDSTGELKPLELPPAARASVSYAAIRTLARLAGVRR